MIKNNKLRSCLTLQLYILNFKKSSRILVFKHLEIVLVKKLSL